MSAVADIQRALNVIRNIERDAAVETRLAALALITGTAADIARELHGSGQLPKNRAAAKSKPKLAMPKPLPIPKPPAQSKPVSPSAPLQPRPKPKPFTEPEQ